MHANIKSLRKALESLGIKYGEIDGFEDAVLIKGEAFIRASTPFNTESIGALCKDKDSVHKILKDAVRMPKTRRFLDPKGRFPEMVSIKSYKDIAAEPLDFLYPRIVKMNHGESGANVFIVRNEKECVRALEMIFDKKSKSYDYIALIQEYIDPLREIRVMVAGKESWLCYDRKTKEEIKGRMFAKIKYLCQGILERIDLSWGAIDFIESKDGKLYFLEVNSRPEFAAVGSVEEYLMVDLYKHALRKYMDDKNRKSAIA